MVKTSKFIFLLICSFTANTINAQQTFTNPLLPSGADPWVIYHDGYYFYTNTTGKNITLWKTNNMGELKDAEKKIVWTPPAGKSYRYNARTQNGKSIYLLVCYDDDEYFNDLTSYQILIHPYHQR